MEKIPTAKEFLPKNSNGKYSRNEVEKAMIEFAKLHVEAMMKDMEQKLLDTLDDHQYLEENVCGVIEEIREYKSDNIK
jgi:hypothetical protein